MTPDIQVLEVLLGSRKVGTLMRLPGENSLFAFNDEYAGDSNRPTLSLSFKGASGRLVTPARPTHLKVPPFFSNLLPEGHLRDYLAARGNVNREREFFLLWLLGQDLPGAVVVHSPDGDSLPPTDQPDAAQDTLPDDPLRFSLAGVQLKFSAVLEAEGGLTIPARGMGGSWIVKLPSARYPRVPENEFVMLGLAEWSGIRVPETRLLSMSKVRDLPPVTRSDLGANAFAIKRFDRERDGERVHTEDFAQVFGLFPADKYKDASYEDMARVIWAETGEAGIAEFSRRLAFSALIGNADMHLKNWSLRYPEGRTPELAPAYDFVSTIAYIDDTQMALSMGGTKSMKAVSLQLFRRFAARAGVPEELVLRSVIETRDRLRHGWHDSGITKLLDAETRSRLERHMNSVTLMNESARAS